MFRSSEARPSEIEAKAHAIFGGVAKKPILAAALCHRVEVDLGIALVGTVAAKGRYFELVVDSDTRRQAKQRVSGQHHRLAVGADARTAEKLAREVEVGLKEDIDVARNRAIADCRQRRSEERRVGKECVSKCRYGWWQDN